jgi:hypothetical protein
MENEKPIPQTLNDFECHGETNREVLALKTAFITAYGLEKFEQLVQRSICKAKSDRAARRG